MRSVIVQRFLLDSFYRIRFNYRYRNRLCSKWNGIVSKVASKVFVALCNDISFCENDKCDYSDVIVSLTSYPARINKVYYALISLLMQSKKPKQIILWLANTDYETYEAVPLSIRSLSSYGITIKFCDDLKSYKKVFYAAKEYGNDYRIVCADDDFLYPSWWLKELVEISNETPGCIVCHRSHVITINDNRIMPYRQWRWYSSGEVGPSFLLHILTGAGVIYPKAFFNDDFFDIDAIMKYAPTADDLWVKMYSLSQGIKVKKTKKYSDNLIEISGEEGGRLYDYNQMDGNDISVDNLMNYFGITVNTFTQTSNT